MDIDRRRCIAAFGALSFCAPGLARAQDAGALVGLWSGSVVDEGRMSRFRLLITADGKATLTLVDSGNLAVEATNVVLKAPAMRLGWPEFELRIEGQLTPLDMIDAQLDQGGRAVPLRFSRGDLFPRKVATLPPPGPMTPDLLDRLRAYADTPAMGAAWALKAPAQHVLVNGLRSADADVAVSPTDRWQIGSCTKSMVAVMLARLVEAGHLSWTLTVGQALGRQIPDIQPAYRDANLLHLLSHHAGMVRDPAMPLLTSFSFDPDADPRPDRLRYARGVLAMPPVAPLGQQMLYSNAGYVVAAAMAESVTGETWETLMRRHLFRPLQMRTAGFGPPAGIGHLDQPSGHKLGVDGKLHPPSVLKQADMPTVMAPAGAVHASFDDMLSYLEATRDHRASFLSTDSWRTLQTPPFGNGYALGWGVTETGGLTHDGSNGQWLARLAVDRPSGLLAAVVMNSVTPEAGIVMDQAHAALRMSR